MDSLWNNLCFAFRQLRKAPGFTLTVMLTLALGIGATTAIFSLVEGILLRPLPFNDPECLVLLGDILGSGKTPGVTAREIATYGHATTAFSSLGGYATTSDELSGGATPEAVNAGRFSAGVFSTLGVRPLLGRVFTQQEEAGRQPLVVISYALWLPSLWCCSLYRAPCCAASRKCAPSIPASNPSTPWSPRISCRSTNIPPMRLPATLTMPSSSDS
jgi:hypothetical protein